MTETHSLANKKGKAAFTGILTWIYTWSDISIAQTTPHVQLQSLMRMCFPSDLLHYPIRRLFCCFTWAILPWGRMKGVRTAGCGRGDNHWHYKIWCYDSKWKMQVSAGLVCLYHDEQWQEVNLFVREKLPQRQRSAQTWEGLRRFSLSGSGSTSRNLVKGVDTTSGQLLQWSKHLPKDLYCLKKRSRNRMKCRWLHKSSLGTGQVQI